MCSSDKGGETLECGTITQSSQATNYGSEKWYVNDSCSRNMTESCMLSPKKEFRENIRRVVIQRIIIKYSIK